MKNGIIDKILEGVDQHIRDKELEKIRIKYTSSDTKNMSQLTCSIGCYQQDMKLDDYLLSGEHSQSD